MSLKLGLEFWYWEFPFTIEINIVQYEAYVQIQKSQECAVSHSNVSILWDQCKRPWEIAAGVLQSHQGKYLLEKVERWSYIRTWFDGSVDQKCWFLAPKKEPNFNDLWTKEVIHCLKKKWTQSADDLLGFCERLWDEFKRFEQPDHFWLQQTCKNYFPEAWVVVYKRLPFSHDINFLFFIHQI